MAAQLSDFSELSLDYRSGIPRTADMEFKFESEAASAAAGRAILADLADRESRQREASRKASRKTRKTRSTPAPGSDSETPTERRRAASRCARLHATVGGKIPTRDRQGLCAACSLERARVARSRTARGRKSRSRKRGRATRDRTPAPLAQPRNARERRDLRRLVEHLAQRAASGDPDAVRRLAEMRGETAQ